MLPSNRDIAVIGGGIVGTACALNLQRAGFSVVLIDRGVPEDAASFGNAGHFAYEQVFPMAGPWVWRQLPRLVFARDSPLSIPPASVFTLASWLARFAWNTRPSQVRRASTALASLLGPAKDAWRRLAAEAKVDALLRTSPILVVARDEDALRAKRPLMAEFRKHGIVVQEVDSRKARSIEPALRKDIAGAFVYHHAQFTVDPGALTMGLTSACRSTGVDVQRGTIDSLEVAGDDRVVVGAGARRWTVRQCVVAAGIGSREVLMRAGFDVPLAAERGYHLMLPYNDQSPRVRVPVIGASPEFVITPMASGLRLAGTVEIAPPDRAPSWQRARMLKGLAEQLIGPLEIAQDAPMWMGCRPTFPDSLPAIGRLPGAPAIIAAFGHQHLGLTLAAITGELVASIASRTPASVELAPFAIERF
jgi:D-amino-acid dehydrogenase